MLFGVKPHGKLALIIDLQSSAVSGTVLLFSELESHVIFETSMHLPGKANASSGRLIKSVQKAVSAVTLAAAKHVYDSTASGSNPGLPRKISEAHIVLSSPWILSQARAVSADFEKETRISLSLVKSMIEKERAAGAPNGEPIRVIEEKVFDVKLNGYSVDKWEGKSATNLTMSFTSSIAASGMIEFLMKDIMHHARTDKIQFHSAILLAEIAAERSHSAVDDFAIIHVHGDATDVAIVLNRCLAFSGSLSLGYRNIARKLSSMLSSDIQVAESAITLYTGGCLDSAHSKKDFSAIEKVKGIWTGELAALIESSASKILPGRIFMISCPHESFFASAISFLYPKANINRISSESYIRDAIHNMEFATAVLK